VLNGLYILSDDSYDKIYGPSEREDIAQLVTVKGQINRETAVSHLDMLRDVDLIFSGWGGPKFTKEFLAAAPNLQAVFYGAGSCKALVTDAFWRRGLTITTAYAANAVPVAEFTLAQIIFCLKSGWDYALSIKRKGAYKRKGHGVGTYGSKVGLVSLGMIGRKTCELLQCLDTEILAYDPFVSEEDAEKLGVTLCSLEELFAQCDVVSLHTPWLKETENMIGRELLASMKENAALINTARGAVVNEPEMISVLQERPDLYAVLDVTYPEPPAPDSPLYTLPNVVLTPHIAGSMNDECRRMGRYMVEELQRYLAGEPLHWAVDQEQMALMA